jgi:predicted nucleic acid-binding protein
MTPSFVVDSNVLVAVQRARMTAEFQACGKLPVVVTDVVWDELTINALAKGARPETVREMEEMLRAIAASPTVLAPQSPEAEVLTALQAPPLTEGIGEHSVIAYAIVHKETTAVLFDRRALHRGVEELRGNVLAFHGFLSELVGRGHVSKRVADSISTSYCERNAPARRPLWWTS